MLHINHHHAVRAKAYIPAFRCSTCEMRHEIHKKKKNTLRSCISSKNTQRGEWGKQSLLFYVEFSVLTSSEWISKDSKASPNAVCTVFIPVSHSLTADLALGEIFIQSAFHLSLIPTHLAACSICWVILSKCLSSPTSYAARPWTNHSSLFFVTGQVTAVLDSLWQWQLTSFVQHPSICQVEPPRGIFTHWFTFNCSWPHFAAFLDLSHYAGVKYAFQHFPHLCLVISRRCEPQTSRLTFMLIL